MLFLPDLVIHAREDSFFTRKLQCGTRLTKPQETVPGRRPRSPSMPIVISSEFILHIIPRFIGPVGKKSLSSRSTEYHPGPVASRCCFKRGHCWRTVPTCPQRRPRVWHVELPTHQHTPSREYQDTFFLSNGCMAQRGRCPGSRPSVSANKRIHDAIYSVVKWQLYKPSINTE